MAETDPVSEMFLKKEKNLSQWDWDQNNSHV